MTSLSDQAQDPARTLGGLLDGIDHASRAQNRYAPIERWLAGELDLQPNDVGSVYVSEPKMVSPRLSTPGIVRRQPDLVLAVIGAEVEPGVFTEAMARKMARDAHLRTVLVARRPRPDSGARWHFPLVLTRPGTAVADRVVGLVGASEIRTVPEPDASSGRGGTARRRQQAADVEVIVEDRLRRMLRYSLVTSRAVVLIGPPGTGKTTLVGQALQDLADDPGHYGLDRAPAWSEPVTPDESWTATEIVGGPTVLNSELVFRPGHVLRSILNGEHLFLDEANRADLDKILGGLLTWLSGSETVVGRLTEAPNAPLVTVGWNDRAESMVVNANLLDDATAEPADGEGPVRFLAGQEWRLVATYNAVDAQRVFRFGEALGRRFAKVPVPPPDVVSVADLITDRCTALRIDPEVAIRIAGLYEVHQQSDETVLGPAPFLEIPAYVASVANGGDADMNDDAEVERVIAEGYLAQIGLSLARLEDEDLDSLGDRLANSSALGVEAWAWIRRMLPALRG